MTVCNRCNRNDEAPAADFAVWPVIITKGPDSSVHRDLCDDCIQATRARYPVDKVPPDVNDQEEAEGEGEGGVDGPAVHLSKADSGGSACGRFGLNLMRTTDLDSVTCRTCRRVALGREP